MKNIGNIIKSLQNIMRKDQGVSGDAQRIEQLGWMITLKIIDDKDKELEIIQDRYESTIPSDLQWRNWAADSEGITGDELKDFVDLTLLPGLKNLDVSTGNKRDRKSTRLNSSHVRISYAVFCLKKKKKKKKDNNTYKQYKLHNSTQR